MGIVDIEALGKHGGGPGCAAPFGFQAMVKDALRSQNGSAELAWQLANYDWVSWYKVFGCADKEFRNISGKRYWEYNFDGVLPQHGYVRVQFRESVLPRPDGQSPLLP
eukprot:6172710-Pleurochrysis_carterae.AAC.5